jgi:DNA topoisomerase-1
MNGRYGPYVQLGDVSDDRKAPKPKRASLFSNMAESTITLEQAQKLLTLPRTLGTHADGDVVIASPGRFGPYVKHGSEFRSLENEDQLFTVTLEEALALLAEPKKSRRRQSAAKSVLREVGKHPASGATINLLAGRYGPYVTDGTTNASLPKGTPPEQVTVEQAVELLAAREGAPKKGRPVKRAAGPRKTTRKRAATVAS